MQGAVEHQELKSDAAIITLRGSMMLGKDGAEMETLVPRLLKAGRKNLIFDLSGVTHMDSTGIGRFIHAYSLVGQAGGQIRLAAAPTYIRTSFRVTRLDTVFKFFPTLEEACEGLN